MAYYFYLDGEQLPLPPAKMSIKIKNKNKTVDLINEGEINMIKDAGLTEVSFDARLPNNSYPFSDYNGTISGLLGKSSLVGGFSFTKAEKFIDKFESLKTSKKPFRLIVVRMGTGFSMLFNTNLLVTLEEYSVEENANDGTDVTCPLKLKQYKYYGTKECEVKTDADGNKTLSVKDTRASEAIQPTSIKIGNISQPASVLEAVKLATGSYDWKDIAAAAGITNPIEKLNPGMVLNIG